MNETASNKESRRPINYLFRPIRGLGVMGSRTPRVAPAVIQIEPYPWLVMVSVEPLRWLTVIKIVIPDNQAPCH